MLLSPMKLAASVSGRLSQAPARRQINEPGSAWALISSVALVAAVAGITGGYGPAIHVLLTFLSGRGATMTPVFPPLYELMPVLLAAITFAFAASIISVIVVSRIFGPGKPNANAKMFGKPNYYFTYIFVLVLAEELFARLLFMKLGLMLWDGPVAVYTLFLVGNGIWALIHLTNYEGGCRNPLRVLPQFLGGIVLTAIFLQYGFMAALLAHFAYDVVAFCGDKLEEWGTHNIKLFVWNAGCAVISWILMKPTHTDISQIGVWFQEDATFAIPGWTWKNYLLVVLFLVSTLEAIMEFLALDHIYAMPIGQKMPELAARLVAQALTVLIIWGGYTLLGFIMHSTPHRVIVVGTVLCFAYQMYSGSSFARVHWQILPDAYLTVCVVMALGFWGAFLFLAARALVEVPEDGWRRQLRTM